MHPNIISDLIPNLLANSFGTDEIYPMIRKEGLTTPDALRTYVEHIVMQLQSAVQGRGPGKLLVTGGGAFNKFLVNRLNEVFNPIEIEVVVPEDAVVKYKEALIMALIGVLRWRQEYNVLSSVTGASRDSIGGALWNGQEA
jgi:Predicted molecular chaperone distantly related to HSP70-fold metalloproteases